MNTDRASLCFHTLRGLRPASSPEPHGKAHHTRHLERRATARVFPRGSGDDAAARSAGAQGVEAKARLPIVESVCVRVHPWAIDSLYISRNRRTPGVSQQSWEFTFRQLDIDIEGKGELWNWIN